MELIQEAVRAALEDADLTLDQIDAMIIGNMDHFEGVNYVDTWSVDGTGAYMKPLQALPGTTGTTLGIAGYHFVASGLFDTVLVVGWEKNSESDTTGAIITCSDPILIASPSEPCRGWRWKLSAYMKAYGIAGRCRPGDGARPEAWSQQPMPTSAPVTVEEVMNSPCSPGR